MKLIIDIDDDVIEGAKSSPNYYPIYHFEKIWRAIVNGTPFDKIRAEIEGLTYYWCEANPKTVIDDALQIIDKYKAESEE